MKRLICNIAFAAVVAAAAAVGCRNTAEPGAGDAGFSTLRGSAGFAGGVGDDTRISMGEYQKSLQGYPLMWSSSDTFAVVDAEAVCDGRNMPEARITKIGSGGSSADFEVRVSSADADGLYYAAVPYSAVSGYDFDGGDEIFYINIPAVQTPTNVSADPRAVILVSELSCVDETGRLPLSFGHAVAYGRMTLEGLETNALECVTLTFPGYEVAGEGAWYINGYEWLGLDATDTIVVDAGNLTPDDDGKFTVWFSLAATYVESGFTVTVKAKNGKTVTKECDASGNPLSFYCWGVTPFRVPMPSAKDDGSVVDPSEYYVVMAKYQGRYYALSAEEDETQNVLLAKDVTSVYGGTATIRTDDRNIIWHFASNGDGTVVLKNYDNGCVGIGPKKSGAVFEAGTETPLSVRDNGDGTFGIYCDSDYLLAYNQNNPGNYWAFYKSSTGCVKDLRIVPVGSGDGPKIDGDDEDDGSGGGSGGGNEDAAANVYRTGWPELPLEYDEDGNGRDDRDPSLYYAHHLCAGGESNAQGGLARNYTVCYSAEHHCPVWIAAPRHSSYEQKNTGRTDAYAPDPDIPANIQYQQASSGNSTYNRGHMLGSAERLCSAATNRQVFYYTNIAPQNTNTFNTGGGAWNNLEDWMDGKVCADTTYVVIGTYFEKYTDGYGYTATPSTISYGGRNDVSCPTMFYYAVLRTKKGTTGKSVKNCTSDELMCAAFVRSHTCAKGTKVSSKDMIPVAELEKITGFTYFANVPNAPKESCTPSDWGL